MNYGDRSSGGGGARQRGGAGRNEPGAPALVEKRIGDHWPGYLKQGYFESGGQLRPEFVSMESVDPLVQAMAGSNPPLSVKQMRQFFGHARRLQAKLAAAPEKGLSAFYAEFFQLQKMAAYRYDGGQNRKIPSEFRSFIDQNTRAIIDHPDQRRAFLDGFMPHFEALVAYRSLHP